MTGVTELVMKECHWAMLHNYMDISRLMVYYQSIEESKLKRTTRELKTYKFDKKCQPRFKKRAQYQDSFSSSRVNHERGCCSQFSKPTCTICGKNHYEKNLANYNGCYGY